MSPLPDDEVTRRLQEALQRMRDNAASARAPKKPMPAPPADVIPPPPHAEPEEDREP